MRSGTPHRGLRVVVAEQAAAGQDARGPSIARALRDAGHEVIYTGLLESPEQIVETAIQEDADLIGLSVPAGAHVPIFTALVGLLHAREAADIVVFAGGGSPGEDISVLIEMGVAKVFEPTASTTEVTRWVAEHFAQEPTAD